MKELQQTNSFLQLCFLQELRVMHQLEPNYGTGTEDPTECCMQKSERKRNVRNSYNKHDTKQTMFH